MVFMVHAVQYKAYQRALANIDLRFILKVFPVNKDSAFMFLTFIFYDNSFFFI